MTRYPQFCRSVVEMLPVETMSPTGHSHRPFSRFKTWPPLFRRRGLCWKNFIKSPFQLSRSTLNTVAVLRRSRCGVSSLRVDLFDADD